MVFGVGTDILVADRFVPLIGRLEDSFWKKAFTEQEMDGAQYHDNRLLYYCSRFAGKEAVFKAISKCKCVFNPKDIEITELEDGQPLATVSGDTADKMKDFLGTETEMVIHISLSFEKDYAIAVAVAETRDIKR